MKSFADDDCSTTDIEVSILQGLLVLTSNNTFIQNFKITDRLVTKLLVFVLMF
jgi:hypothetical protein